MSGGTGQLKLQYYNLTVRVDKPKNYWQWAKILP